jgi:hypothetical protein
MYVVRRSEQEKFFAKVERRLERIVDCVALVTVVKSQYGIHTEVDVVLYRLNRREVRFGGKETFELVRFLTQDKELAFNFFPHGPPFLNSGPAWKETTGWLAPVIDSYRTIQEHGLVMVEEYPQKILPTPFSLSTCPDSRVLR